MRNIKKIRNATSLFNISNDGQILMVKNSNKSRKSKRANHKTNILRKNAKHDKEKSDSDESRLNTSIVTSDVNNLERNSIEEVVSHLASSLNKESISNIFPINDLRSSPSGVHTLFHYTPNQRVEKINFDKDKCPVCNYLKRQRIQSSDSMLESTECEKNVKIKLERFRVKSASEGSDQQSDSRRNSSQSSNHLSFTFAFSSPTENDAASSPSVTGISVDLTKCENVSFKIEKITEFSSRQTFTSWKPNRNQLNYISKTCSDSTCQYNANGNFGSNSSLFENFSTFSLNPYVSVLIPNSLKKCIFCNSNLTFCYECRKTDPGYFSNFNYSCSSCNVCNYNEYSDFISKSACVIAEPIQSTRVNDIFDSLKTCLIPHRFLNYYKVVAPPNRIWNIIEQPSDGMSFTLMCYNVLCQKYATASMYPYCPTFALDWEYRKRGILEEIWKYNADIICLQELETSQFENVFAIELKKRNYDSVFVPKSRSRTMHESDSKCVDGCAIFWKVECFDKVHHFTHEFMLSCCGVSKNPAPELLNRVMSRDNVALSVILEVKDPKFSKRRLCVSTGHIHWDPEYSDVKVIQTLFWTSELWNYIREFYKKENFPNMNPNEMPVILCGDFNSLPESAVIDYLVKGEVERSHVDFRDFGDKYLFEEWTQIQEEFVENDSLRHHFNFDRAYKDENESGLKWTNYTYDFRGIIDYIFYSKDRLKLLGNLKQIPEAWFEQQKIVGAPHVHLNSDHFSLLVELELKNLSAGTAAVSNSTSSQQRPNCIASVISSSTVSSSATYPFRSGQSTWS